MPELCEQWKKIQYAKGYVVMDESEGPRLGYECECGMKPRHEIFDHDSICSICGGTHSKNICPLRKKYEKRNDKE